MVVYLFILGYWGAIATILNQNFKNRLKNDSKIYFILAGFSLFFLMASRNISVGTDTIRYLYEFENADFYLNNLIRSSERGYSYFNFFANKLGISFQIYLSIISAIFMIAISKLYYKYSKNILMSYYLHVTIGLFAMSMTGLRQSLAISLTIISFISLMNNKKFLFFLFVFIAYTFHNSAIAFIPVYFLKNLKLNRKSAILIYLLSASLFFVKSWIAGFISIMSPDRYSRYWIMQDSIDINPLVILVALAIPLAAIIFWPKIDTERNLEKESISILFVLSCINFIVYFFALEVMLLERISLYFMAYNTILIPNVIRMIKNKDIRRIGWAACIILPLLQFIISTPGGSFGIGEYKFFWE